MAKKQTESETKKPGGKIQRFTILTIIQGERRNIVIHAATEVKARELLNKYYPGAQVSAITAE